MTTIFISYRRDDSAGYAGRIHDRLSGAFGPERTFMDVDNIPIGVNFVDALSSEVAKCDVLLALIGRRWLDAADEDGARRLDDPADFVRIEIEAALQRGIPVVPVLVDGASVPRADALPQTMAELAFRNGVDVRHGSFNGDVSKLIRGIQALPTATTHRSGVADVDSSTSPEAPEPSRPIADERPNLTTSIPISEPAKPASSSGAQTLHAAHQNDGVKAWVVWFLAAMPVLLGFILWIMFATTGGHDEIFMELQIGETRNRVNVSYHDTSAGLRVVYTQRDELAAVGAGALALLLLIWTFRAAKSQTFPYYTGAAALAALATMWFVFEVGFLVAFAEAGGYDFAGLGEVRIVPIEGPEYIFAALVLVAFFFLSLRRRKALVSS